MKDLSCLYGREQSSLYRERYDLSRFRPGAVDMPRDVPVQELDDLVGGSFCMHAYIFIGINEGGFDDRLHPLLIQPAETAGEVTEAHDRVRTDLTVRIGG